MRHGILWVGVIVVAIASCKHRAADEPTPAPAKPAAAQVATPAMPAATQAPASCPADATRTTAGCVRGEHADKLVVYRGIPYAAPPIGARRWKPPAPAAAWDGVRETTAFGMACPQGDATIGGKLATDEDCLTLNVWAPAGAAAKLPVMVWIHGGGFVQGGSALPVYDGVHLAKAGVVVVSLNYRLGPLGFFAHPGLTAEDTAHHASGNLGILDQIAALEWVKSNIAAFGGDAKLVTIFGESAGGESVCALMASPLATGLFARAIIESGQCVAEGKALRTLHEARGNVESAEAQGERIAKALGCDGTGAVACLRGQTPDALLKASPASFGFLGKGEHYGLAVDGYVLRDAPATQLANGTLADLPTIIGTTADEATLFTIKMPIRGPAVFMAIVAKLFPGSAREVLAQYAPRAYGGAKPAFDALVTDVVFGCPTRRAARALRKRQAHVFRYVFTHVTAAAAAKHAGATHGSEVPFVFGTMTSPTDDERGLSSAMVDYWTRFARTGDPNDSRATAWPVYDGAKDSYLELATPIAARAGLRTAACDVLDSLAPVHDDVDPDAK